MSEINVLLQSTGMAVVANTDTDLAIVRHQKGLYTIGLNIRSGTIETPATAIINTYLIAPTIREVLRFLTIHPYIYVRKYIDANLLLDGHMLNPINRKKQMVEILSNHLNIDLSNIVASYIDRI